MTEKQHGIEALSQFAMDVVRQAGAQALGFYGKGQPGVKFDEGLVTETELKVIEYFRAQLNQRFPEHQLFNIDTVREEYTHDAKRYLWIFDAVDGVSNIQAGIPVWGTSLALLENFWPIIGVIHLPSTGDIFHARAGQEALWNDKKISVSPQDSINDESLLFTYSRFHQHFNTTFPGKIRNMGSTAAHICYVAMGRAEAAIISHESFQGLAAARVIVEAAGGKIYRLDGGEFHLNEYLDGDRIDEPLLVSTPQIISQVCDTLERTQFRPPQPDDCTA